MFRTGPLIIKQLAAGQLNPSSEWQSDSHLRNQARNWKIWAMTSVGTTPVPCHTTPWLVLKTHKTTACLSDPQMAHGSMQCQIETTVRLAQSSGWPRKLGANAFRKESTPGCGLGICIPNSPSSIDPEVPCAQAYKATSLLLYQCLKDQIFSTFFTSHTNPSSLSLSFSHLPSPPIPTSIPFLGVRLPLEFNQSGKPSWGKTRFLLYQVWAQYTTIGNGALKNQFLHTG